MTGYGQGAAEGGGLKVSVEMRSVNNRFVDLKLRLPDDLAPMEQDLRRKVLATVKRGRVDMDLRLERAASSAVPLVLNRPVVLASGARCRYPRDRVRSDRSANLIICTSSANTDSACGAPSAGAPAGAAASPATG